MERTLKDCSSRSLTLWQFDDQLWDAIRQPLDDCQTVLDELSEFVNSLNTGPSQKGPGIFKKTSLQIQLIWKGNDLQALKEKIGSSACAMQTALATVNV